MFPLLIHRPKQAHSFSLEANLGLVNQDKNDSLCSI